MFSSRSFSPSRSSAGPEGSNWSGTPTPTRRSRSPSRRNSARRRRSRRERSVRCPVRAGSVADAATTTPATRPHRNREEGSPMSSAAEKSYGQSTAWRPERPRLRLFPLVISWLGTGIALMVAAGLLPGVDIKSFWGALVVAVIVAALNAVIPPLLAALKLPLTLVLGFLLVLIADALILLLADALTDGVIEVDNFGWALL